MVIHRFWMMKMNDHDLHAIIRTLEAQLTVLEQLKKQYAELMEILEEPND